VHRRSIALILSLACCLALVAFVGQQLRRSQVQSLNDRLRQELDGPYVPGASPMDPGAVARLLRSGAGIQTRSHAGQTVLMYAAWWGDEALAKYAIHKGMSADLKDVGGGTALMYAASAGQSRLLACLLECGANANLRNDTGWTPLTYAISQGNTRDIALLVSHHATVDLTSKTTRDVLREALQGVPKNRQSQIRHLLHANAVSNRAEGRK
jgi:ankyrin repeat protein